MVSQLIQDGLDFLEREVLHDAEGKEAPEKWGAWLKELFPTYATHDFSDHHSQFWDWVWSIKKGEASPPFVAIWPRGGAKSTSVEMACVALGARQTRRFVLYISETQDQANDHVGNIASMLESSVLSEYYPVLTEKAIGKFGNQKGWKVSRLRTSLGFSVVGVGLDSAARGLKLEELRPDLIVLDDIDGELDQSSTTEKKIKTITKKLLPTGSRDATVLFVQNLIHEDSIASRLVDGRADFMANRIVSGPIPAIRQLAIEEVSPGIHKIVSGTPSWSGQSLEICQEYIDRFGPTAFKSECQHDVTDPPGGMFSHLTYQRCEWSDVPDFVRIAVWVDPAVTDNDNSDSMGIQADALGVDGKIYRLWSWEQITSPEDAISRAIAKAVELKADSVGIETDQGGDTWESVFQRSLERVQAEMKERAEETGEPAPFYWPSYKYEKAGSGYGPKRHRAQQMLTDYERGLIVHVVGTHERLERALFRFPKKKPYDLVDAAFWSWKDLREGFDAPATGHFHF